jgi:CO/xanthine dehydrogenase FAD-binding subunit
MDLPTVVEHRRGPDLPAWEPGDAWLAGGTWLFSEPQPGVRRLLDLTTLGWKPVVVRSDRLEIAATCTIAELAGFRCPPQWGAAGLIRASCEAFLASFKIWNVATVGGNICTALPAGPMIALVAALDGTCTVFSPDGSSRELTVTELVVGPGRTTLAPGELLRSVSLPVGALRSPAALRKASLRPLGRSAALVIGRQDKGRLVLTITASTGRPVLLELASRPDAAQLRAALDDALALEDYHDDVHGDPRWRQHLTHRLAEEIRRELTTSPRAA